MLQHALARLVLEAHVAELHLALNGRPVLFARRKGCAEAGRHLGRIHNVWLCVQKVYHALGRGLRGLHFGQNIGKLLNGVEQLRGVADEGGQRAEVQHGGKHKAAAPHKGQRCGDAAKAHHKGQKQRAPQSGAHAGAAHGARKGVKLFAACLFAHQRLGGHGAHDAPR